jgi:hypothetical protein
LDRELTPIYVSGQRISRRHALKTFAAAAGGALVASSRVLGDLPWGEPEWTPQIERSGKLTLLSGHDYEKEIRQDFPTIVMEPDGRALWTTWTQAQNGVESILARRFDIAAEKWEAPIPISTLEKSTRSAAQSEAVFVDGRLLVVWSECDGPRWYLLSRSLNAATKELGAINIIAGEADTAGYNSRPALVTGGSSGAFLAWQAKPAGAKVFNISTCLLYPDGKPLDKPQSITTSDQGDCCRPAVAMSQQRAAVAYDAHQVAGSQNIFVAVSQGQAGHLLSASRDAATNIAPSLAWSPDGDTLWVAWQSNRCGESGWDIPKWVHVSGYRISDDSWYRPAGWSAPDPDAARHTMQGLEFPRLVVTPGGAPVVLARPSHAFCVQYFTGREQSPLYRLPDDDWGGRGRWLRGAFDPAGRLWVTRRDLRRNVLQAIDGFDKTLTAPELVPDEETRSTAPLVLSGRTERYTWPPVRGLRRADKVAEEQETLFFGDIHGHSYQSDGMGDPEESFVRARDVFRDDFHALTDHDRFVAKRVTDGLWQEQKDLVAHYHAEGEFVTLFALEWTTPRVGDAPHGWGHYCVYSDNPALPLFDHGDERYQDLPELIAVLKEYGGICIPHHIGWTGVRWDVWDPAVIPAVEICSVHGAYEHEGNEPLRHRGGMPGHFVRDGLHRGMRFGIVGGSDQHGLIWHHGICWKRNAYRAGLTGVWAKDKKLTRAGLLEAIRARRTFATTGVKMCLRFRVAGATMGEEVKSDGPPKIEIDVSVPPEEGALRWLSVIRNGEVIRQVGGEAQRTLHTFVDEDAPKGRISWYYLRVQLADNNMAWSSPVWVDVRK